MTQNRETLLALADRAETETEAYQYISIMAAMDAIAQLESSNEIWARAVHYHRVGAYLDAAMSLVPEGWEPIIDCRRTIEVQLETIAVDPGTLDPRKVYATGATPALALCAASLRARAALEQANG